MSVKLTNLILKVLAENFKSSVSLEELAEIAGLDELLTDELPDLKPDQHLMESILLENLIIMNDQGMVLLEEMTDRSTITPKGLHAVSLIENSYNKID